jgi:hypothetical protein
MVSLWNNPSYDKYTRPNESAVLAANVAISSAKPEDVQVELRFDSLAEVSTIHGSFDVLVTQKRSWSDWRLRFNGTASGGCLGDTIELQGKLPIWKPDLYYGNLVREGLVVGEYTRVYADGRVLWKTKQRLTLSCMMDFTRMPYDSQHCVTRMSTFAGKDRDVQLGLYGSGIQDIAAEKFQRQYSYLKGSTEWRLIRAYAEVFDHKAIGDDDTALDFVIEMQRDSSYWEHYVLVPAILVVVMSYGSFFVTRAAPPARGGAALFSFLTLANILTGVRASLPKARGEHSVLLLDILKLSLYWCCYTVLEFALGSWLARAVARADKYRKGHTAISESGAYAESGGQQETPKEDIKRSVGRCTYWLMRRDMTIRFTDKHVDIFSRIFFLPSYIIALLIRFQA